ncbi:uncharacterized protein LOC129582921 [Paramacrobiotus metropolitanus]|uniref:uncharacterized protein LOC129582921 n=1 Tax=Paramacrobiotus metropolitanus TaxID=2943436 RepID=UPI002445F13D|nr:uncharacterized protein LOC129582921 [Paramacrobiotus metropolitanus]
MGFIAACITSGLATILATSLACSLMVNRQWHLVLFGSVFPYRMYAACFFCVHSTGRIWGLWTQKTYLSCINDDISEACGWTIFRAERMKEAESPPLPSSFQKKLRSPRLQERSVADMRKVSPCRPLEQRIDSRTGPTFLLLRRNRKLNAVGAAAKSPQCITQEPLCCRTGHAKHPNNSSPAMIPAPLLPPLVSVGCCTHSWMAVGLERDSTGP